MASHALTASSPKVAHARMELARMRSALRSWLTYRAKNDLVMAGGVPKGREGKLRADARIIISDARSRGTLANPGHVDVTTTELEQKLATQIHTLLSELMPNARLPNPDVRQNPRAAVELAQIALGDRVLAPGLGNISTVPWLPIAIVGGVLLTITTAIKSHAELAAERERIACIKAGACTDYGFWLKVAALAGIGWFAWTQLGLKEKVARMKK